MEKPLIVILAGGIGKRFEPFVTNKTLVPILGKPLIQYTLEMLERVGCTEVLLPTNQYNDAWLSSYKSQKLKIRTKRQPEPHGMGDAVLQIEEEIGQRPIIVMNALDIVEDRLMVELLEKSKDAYALVTARKIETYFPGGYLEVEGDKAVSIVEKPEPGTEPSDLVNMVFHYFSNAADFVSCLKSSSREKDDHYEQALAKLMKEKEVKYVSYDGYWQAVKFPHHILEATTYLLEHHLKKHTAPTAHVSDKATIEGTVYIDEGAKIYEGAVIKGPAYIGKNVVVGNHTLIRHASIEEGSIVGMTTEIGRSYIGPRCAFHANFIGDSVLEGNVNPSFGTATANLRIDGREVQVKYLKSVVPSGRTKCGAIIGMNAFFGINCSIMPGITIGANAKIFPGSVINAPVPPHATVKTTQNQEVVV